MRVGSALAVTAALAILIAGCGISSSTEAPPQERGAEIRKFWVLYREASALRARGDLQAAERLYEEALRIDPRHEDSLYYYGQLLHERGAWSDARAAFERLVEVNPASARGHLALGTLLAGTEEGAPFDPARAEAHLMRAHEINGEETAPMVRLGEIRMVRGDAEGARHWLEAAARTNPKSVEAACLAGYLRWLAGDAAGASDYYGKAVRAARADKPIHGVLNEGDRKSSPPAGTVGSAPVAAPPLKKPMGETLFGAFCADLPEEPSGLESIYGPIRAAHTALLR